MYRLETTKPLYEKIKELLPDIWPNIQIRLMSEDSNLVRLGFVDSVPCVVELDVDEKQFEEILYSFYDLEVDAYNTEDGKDPPQNDPFYQKYLKYGWIGDVLARAKLIK